MRSTLTSSSTHRQLGLSKPLPRQLFHKPAAIRTTQGIGSCADRLDVKHEVQHEAKPSSPAKAIQPIAAAAAAAVLLSAPDAHAFADKVAEFAASGFLFKDSVEVTALDDPEVLGVTVYVSDFKRSIVDKLAKDFFSEPSQASISCVKSGRVSFRQGTPDKLGGPEGQEMFSESKGLNLFKNKTLRIRRIYDPARNNLVYVAYSTRLSTAADDGNVSSGRYRTSLCTLSLPESVLEAPDVAASR